jgi:acylphosphatase
MSEKIEEEYRKLLLDYAELCVPYEIYEEYAKTTQIELCSELSVKAFELFQQAPEREDIKVSWKITTELARRAVIDGYPENYEENIELIRKGDLSSLESLVQFLEQDQWFFRSGYAKAYLINVIKKVALSDGHQERLLHPHRLFCEIELARDNNYRKNSPRTGDH